jgi:hypothetical protein
MSDVFISHVEKDRDIAIETAQGLEAVGYTTGYYERDSLPGLSYLSQSSKAIEQSQVVILVISQASLGATQVISEVVHAYESNKSFIPLLRDITHVGFQARQPEWRRALGAATSIPIPSEGITAIIPRIIGGLQALGVEAHGKPRPIPSVETSQQRGPSPPPVARRWVPLPFKKGAYVLLALIGFASVFFVSVRYELFRPHESMPSWVGNWQQEFRGVGGKVFQGSLPLEQAGDGEMTGTFTSLDSAGGHRGTVRGAIGPGGTLEGQWRNERAQVGRFKFLLAADGKSFQGTYSMNDEPAEAKPANWWNGVRVQ